METIRICPSCGKPVAANAPKGLCPECLLKGAFPSDSGGPAPRWTPPSPEELRPHFPQLEILELAGAGGMGAVYKARQLRLDRLVALKILPVNSSPDPSFSERFTREARALAKLNHPGIVTIHDFGQTENYYFFIMEYVDGVNLRELIQTKSLSPRQALDLVTQICAALQFAHDEHIVHRDIKPENILITKKGQVKIADFGLAKLLGARPDTALTASQMVMGTFNYMAPEQRERPLDVDHRADIYSLGVVFYEMLTGEVPMGRFDAPSKKVQIDVRLDEVVLHALEREPARRYQQVSEVQSNVEAISSTLPKEPPAGGVPGTFKGQPPPPFVQFVGKRFVIFAVVWLFLALCLRFAFGDKTISIQPGDPFLKQAGVVVLACICAPFTLSYAEIILSLAFVVLLAMWFEARERRGLKLKQFSPRCRRRQWLWVGASTLLYLIVVFGSMHYLQSSGALRRALNRDLRTQSAQATEWWFTPNGGNFEKIGFKVNFAKEAGHGSGFYDWLPDCTITLLLHQSSNQPPTTMMVTAPGLRSKYRIPATNSWDYDAVLDRENLIDWLHKGAGLDPAAPKFKDEAEQIYTLLKTYENTPPETVTEFVNMARADLRDFWFQGSEMHEVTYDTGKDFLLMWLVLGLSSVIYAVAGIWGSRQIYREGWREIEAGQWAPPVSPAQLAASATAPGKGLTFELPKSLFIAGLKFALAFVAAAIVGSFVPLVGIFLFCTTLLAAAVQLSVWWEIEQAREKGLWPASGQMATLDHVQRLAQAGEKKLAAKLYRQIHNVSGAESKAAVEKLVK